MSTLKYQSNLLGSTSQYNRYLGAGGFRGIDTSDDPSKINDLRFADIVNMWKDYENQNGTAVETMVGYRKIKSFSGASEALSGSEASHKINGIYKWVYNAGQEDEVTYIIVHSGTSVHLFEKDAFYDATGIADYSLEDKLPDKKSNGFQYQNRFFLLCGKYYEVVIVGGKIELKEPYDAAYIPTTYIDGIEYEQENAFTSKVKNKYLDWSDELGLVTDDTGAVITETVYYSKKLYDIVDFAKLDYSLYKNTPTVASNKCTVTNIPTVTQSRNAADGVDRPSHKYIVCRVLDQYKLDFLGLPYAGSKLGGTDYTRRLFAQDDRYNYFLITCEYLTISEGAEITIAVNNGEGEEGITEGSQIEIDFAVYDFDIDIISSVVPNTGAGEAVDKVIWHLLGTGETPTGAFSFRAKEGVANKGGVYFYPIFVGSVLSSLRLDYQSRDFKGTYSDTTVDISNAPIANDTEITITYPKAGTEFHTTGSYSEFSALHDSSMAEAINGCTLVDIFDERVFLTGNPRFPNTIFFSTRGSTGYVDPTYFGVLNWMDCGMSNEPITAMIHNANNLIVFKGDTIQDSVISLYTPYQTGIDIIPKTYIRSDGLAGTGCLGLACNLRDDIVFLSRKGLEGVDRQTVNTERSIGHRSTLIDARLLTEDLREATFCEWKDYLVVMFPSGNVYMADTRQISSVNSSSQYEWYVLKDVGTWTNDQPVYKNMGYIPSMRIGAGNIPLLFISKSVERDGVSFVIDADTGTVTATAGDDPLFSNERVADLQLPRGTYTLYLPNKRIGFGWNIKKTDHTNIIEASWGLPKTHYAFTIEEDGEQYMIIYAVSNSKNINYVETPMIISSDYTLDYADMGDIVKNGINIGEWFSVSETVDVGDGVIQQEVTYAVLNDEAEVPDGVEILSGNIPFVYDKEHLSEKVVEEFAYPYYNSSIETDIGVSDFRVLVIKTGELRGGNFCKPCSLKEIDDLLLFGTENGDICVFNTDKRGVRPSRLADEDISEAEYRRQYPTLIDAEWYDRCGHAYLSGATTAFDNANIPHLTKDTVKKSCVIEVKQAISYSFYSQFRTENSTWSTPAVVSLASRDYSEEDFMKSNFSTSTNDVVAVTEKTKKWASKQYRFYNYKFRSPFGFYGISYRYSIHGRIKN